MKKILFAALLTISLISCKKDPVDPEPTPTPAPTATTGSLKVNFEAMVDTSELVFDTQNYVNANLDTFKVNVFKYYVSNVVLTKSDNSTYVVPNSYFLVDHKTSGANMITLTGVPIANYKSIQFIIGVDSTRNVSGAQEGALAVSNNMFWSWNSGYIFAKMEGTSPQSGNSSKNLAFHIGGFAGANNALKTITISFGSSTANVSASVTPEVHLTSDLSKWFKGANTITFATQHSIMMPGMNALKIASNYANMFAFEHVHN